MSRREILVIGLAIVAIAGNAVENATALLLAAKGQALALSAIAIWQITGDGEARDYEGRRWWALFVIVGAVAFFE